MLALNPGRSEWSKYGHRECVCVVDWRVPSRLTHAPCSCSGRAVDLARKPPQKRGLFVFMRDWGRSLRALLALGNLVGAHTGRHLFEVGLAHKKAHAHTGLQVAGLSGLHVDGHGRLRFRLAPYLQLARGSRVPWAYLRGCGIEGRGGAGLLEIPAFFS